MNQTQRNISTIEDPIEIYIDGINQTAVNAKTGLTFSQTLRALLRQDPDVLMIGEIRDTDTAEMAIRAAQTGHLVLSTLHANNTTEAIVRLSHIGIAPFHLCSALSLIIAQRLVRKLCNICKRIKHFQNSILEDTGLDTASEFYIPTGCSNCSAGYAGRIGIFELLPITTAIQNLILNRTTSQEMVMQNNRDGHHSLWLAGIAAVKDGVTSLDEIYRVIPK